MECIEHEGLELIRAKSILPKTWLWLLWLKCFAWSNLIFLIGLFGGQEHTKYKMTSNFYNSMVKSYEFQEFFLKKWREFNFEASFWCNFVQCMCAFCVSTPWSFWQLSRTLQSLVVLTCLALIDLYYQLAEPASH